jgi:hypothetical protein
MHTEFKIPDLNAPRFFQKSHQVINDDFINQFIEKYPKYKGLTKTEYKNIIRKFNENVWQKVIEERDGVRLPENIGVIFIGACAPPKKSYNPDFNLLHTKEIVASNKNWETDGNLAKIFFVNHAEKYKYRFKDYWVFIPSRIFKRTVSKEFPKNWNMYHKIDPKKKIGMQFVVSSSR